MLMWCKFDSTIIKFEILNVVTQKSFYCYYRATETPAAALTLLTRFLCVCGVKQTQIAVKSKVLNIHH